MKAEKASRALDGVYGAEDICQELCIAGACLKKSQAPFHSIEAVEAFKEKFAS